MYICGVARFAKGWEVSGNFKGPGNIENITNFCIIAFLELSYPKRYLNYLFMLPPYVIQQINSS